MAEGLSSRVKASHSTNWLVLEVEASAKRILVVNRLGMK